MDHAKHGTRARSVENLKRLEKGYPLKTESGTKVAKPSLREDLRYKLNRRNRSGPAGKE